MTAAVWQYHAQRRTSNATSCQVKMVVQPIRQDDERAMVMRFDVVANDWVRHRLGSLLPSTPDTILEDVESDDAGAEVSLAA